MPPGRDLHSSACLIPLQQVGGKPRPGQQPSPLLSSSTAVHAHHITDSPDSSGCRLLVDTETCFHFSINCAMNSLLSDSPSFLPCTQSNTAVGRMCSSRLTSAIRMYQNLHICSLLYQCALGFELTSNFGFKWAGWYETTLRIGEYAAQ